MDAGNTELDILREIGSIGSGQAATSLSELLGKKINVVIEEANFVPITEFTDLVGGADKVVVAIYCELSGEVSGMMHMMFARDNALRMVDLLMGKQHGETKIIEQMDESAFKEVGNILFGAYLTSLSNMLEIKVLFSVPNIAHDLAGAILDFSLVKLASKVERVMTIKTRLEIEGESIEGSLIALFDNEAMERITGTIKERYLKS